jgi:flagellar basal-body rod protein FlgF
MLPTAIINPMMKFNAVSPLPSSSNVRPQTYARLFLPGQPHARRRADLGRRAGRGTARAGCGSLDMQNGLYVSLSAQVALERRLEMIANNVANMNTVGYRAEGVSFETEVAKAGDNRIAYVSGGSSFISRQTGASIKTGNPLDLAIQGSGWFAISTAEGTVYTRDGRMRLAETGALETLNGDAVLDAGGAPILLSTSAGPPTISGDGMITQDGKQVGAIGLFAIDDDAKLTRAENSAVIPDKPATPILDFTQNGVTQGFLEGSNVNPIQEMTKLIAVTREFDSVTQQVTQTEASVQEAIKTLGSSS